MEVLDFTFERREKLIRRDSLEEGKLDGKIELLSEMEFSVSEIAEKLAVSEQKVMEVLGKGNQQTN